MRCRFILLFLTLLCTYVRAQESQQANILMIAVDDLKPLIGAYGDAYAITPNLDRLAAMGVIFTNAHCQQAVCGPSRASLLTGMRPDVTRVWDLKTQMRSENPGIITLPQYLKSVGYATMGMGKIFDPRSVDKGLDQVSWSVPYHRPVVKDKRLGVPILGRYQSAENKAKFIEIRAEAKAAGVPSSGYYKYLNQRYKPATEAAYVSDEGYFDGALTRDAIERIKEQSKTNEPFMLCVGYQKPHLPFIAPQQYWDLYTRAEVPLAPWQKKAAATNRLPYHTMGELKSYSDIPDDLAINNLLPEAKQRELIHGYYACVSYIDAQIGKLLDALEANGLNDNTSIVLWGDHGWHLGDHGLWNKHSNFEQATRSPLIIATPGGKQGVVNTSPVEFIDVFPTICEITGKPIPTVLQGQSLLPIVNGQVEKVKDFAISQYPRANVMGYALRTDQYRYVAWYKGERGKPEAGQIVFKELYDYVNDPVETTNVVGMQATLADELQEVLTNFLEGQVEVKANYQPMVPTEHKTGLSRVAPNSESGATFREIILNKFKEPFYLGATVAANQLGTPAEGILTRNYNYTVAENAGKQAQVHPTPNKWNWENIDAIVAMAERNGLAVRLHGPISPQASHWVKADERTGEELVPMMEDFMTRQCIRYNGKAVVKWMDVVNETVTPEGEWFGPKPGVDKWENPWTIIGSDKDRLKTPLYISRAFEIAKEHAPDISLVFNQHGGMEKKMWDRVKATILYLRAKGLRVDGLGWQAHLDERRNVGGDPKQLDQLRALIDWAHANGLDFHVTEIDYKIRGKVNAASQADQAKNYANILAVLLEKRSTGVVTFNTWGIHDREGKHTNLSRFLFNQEGAPKPAVFAMKKVLESGK